jgi:hypothetical protein
MSVCEFGMVTPDAHTVLCVPRQDAVVGDVTPKQFVALRQPNRAFAPLRSAAQALQHTGCAGDLLESGVKDLQHAHGLV